MINENRIRRQKSQKDFNVVSIPQSGIEDKNLLCDSVIEKLQTVYDPEFPMVDIYTLGLIYKVTIQEADHIIHILMTFTTAACPMAELLQDMIRNSLAEIAPEYIVTLEITFDPMRSPSLIRDEDLKKMFDL